MITSGMHESVLVIGTDKSPKGYFPSVPVLADEPQPPVDMVRWQVGVPNPAYWALEMRKRMEAYGSTEEHLAKVKVKNSKHGAPQSLCPVSQGVQHRAGAGLAHGVRPTSPSGDLRHFRRGGSRPVGE